jgi:uncharacterized membrane protein
MLSNHYPLAFATKYNWIIASLVFLMGVTIRHYFNSRHSRKGNPTWTWLVTALIFVVIAWLSTAPLFFRNIKTGDIVPAKAEQRFAQAPGFKDVVEIVQARCSMCHAAEPGYPGILWPPKGVRLETPAEVAHEAKMIYLEAGVTDAMPPANVSMVEASERAKIVAWYRAAVGEGPKTGS